MADVMPMTMEDITSKASSLNIDLSSIDWTSIRVPPNEDFGIISDEEDMVEEEGLLEEGFGNVIIVDNIPIVSSVKFDKLERVLRKIFSLCGVIKEDGLWIPVEEGTGRTRGYCFIEFNTSKEAELAKEKTDKFKLDRAHAFAVNMFDDIEKLSRVPDELAPPATTSYTLENLMAPRFPKCQMIAKRIGDRRIDKVLYEIFSREKEAYQCDERDYNERIEEVQARIDHRHGIIIELEKFGFDPIMDEPLAVLKAAEQDDLADRARLTQMSHIAALRATEKSMMMKKMKIVK